MTPDISVIIPALNEQDTINRTLGSLLKQPFDGCLEVIVVDGSPDQSTIQCIDHPSVKTMGSQKGRACQMNAGASAASGYVLLFLHSDTLLPENALNRIQDVMRSRSVAAGAFNLEINAKGFVFRMIEASASLRSRLTRIPYGDQAIFIKRSWFNRAGGFRQIPIMEDVDLMQRLKKTKEIQILNQAVLTSARRWRREGPLLTTLRNWAIMLLYLAGTDPKQLVKLYPDHSD